MKKHYFLFVLIAILILLTGCGNNVSSEGIDIVINVEREGNFLTSSGEMDVLIDKEILFTIDGTSSGSAKVNLREGKHTIQVKAQGDKSEKLEFDVSNDGDRRLYFTAEVGNFLGVELILRDDIPDELKKEYIISQQEQFHDDVAWIIFSDIDDIEYLGCIDKKGELLFKYNIESIEQYAHFSNGYAYLFTDEKVLVIDKTGTILSSHPLNRENYWLCENACADGYIVTKEYVGDFESSKLEYKIYNAAGDLITNYASDENEEWFSNVLYCGENVFQFRNDFEFDYREPCKYYFAATDKWLDAEKSNITKMNNGFGLVFVKTEYVYDEMTNGTKNCISYVDSTGQFKEINIELQTEGISIIDHLMTISNQKCIIPLSNIFSSQGLLIYDLESDNMFNMPEEYADKINWENREVFKATNNKMLVPLKGADNDNYVALFDYDFNILEEPFKIINYWQYEDGTVMLETDLGYTIYDKHLEKVSDNASEDIIYGYYSDGVSLVVKNGGKIYYYTLDNQLLFDEIYIENAALIELSE